MIMHNGISYESAIGLLSEIIMKVDYENYPRSTEDFARDAIEFLDSL